MKAEIHIRYEQNFKRYSNRDSRLQNPMIVSVDVSGEKRIV